MTEEYGLTPEARAELEAKYPRHRWTIGLDDEWACMLIPPPKDGDVTMYKAKLHSPEDRAEAQKTLWRKMVVYVWDKWNGGSAREGETNWGGPSSLTKFLAALPMAPEGCNDEFGALIGLKTKKRGE